MNSSFDVDLRDLWEGPLPEHVQRTLILLEDVFDAGSWVTMPGARSLFTTLAVVLLARDLRTRAPDMSKRESIERAASALQLSAETVRSNVRRWSVD